MRILYNPKTKESIEATPDRLKMYQRLLRLENDDPNGLSHILRILAGVEEPLVLAYHESIAPQLAEINFIQAVQAANGQKGSGIRDTAFTDFVTERHTVWRGLFNGGNKLANVTLITNIRQGDQAPDKSIINLKEIHPEEKPNSCTIS